MHGKSSNQDPGDGADSSTNDKGTAPRACGGRVHVVRCDLVEALFGFGAERDDETNVHHNDRDHETRIEIVSPCSFWWEHHVAEQAETKESEACYAYPLRGDV